MSASFSRAARLVRDSTVFARLTAVVLSVLLLAVIQPQRLNTVLSSLVFPGSDNDGTYWWLMSRCREDLWPLVPNRIDTIAFGHGFDVHSLPFWNLYDQFRIVILKAARCDISQSVGLLNALHLLCYSVTAGSVFGFIRRLTQVNFAAVVGTLLFVSVNFIDNSRIQISATVPFFAVMALSRVVDLRYSWTTTRVGLIAIFILLQTMVNAYIGIFTVITAFVVIMTHPQLRMIMRGRYTRFTAVLLTAQIGGLSPLIPGQLELLRESSSFAVVRPTQVSRNLLEPWIVFSRPSATWFGLPVDPTGQGPRLSWLSAGFVLMMILGVWKFVDSAAERAVVWRALTAAALLLTLLYLRFPLQGGVLDWVLERVAFVRSVSMLQFFFFLLLSSACALVVAELIQGRRKSLSSYFGLVLISVAIFGHLVESVSAQREQFTSVEVKTVVYPWRAIGNNLKDGAFAHYPDIHDEFGEFDFGFPNRIIEIAQLGHGRPVLNGRDATEFLNGCGALPDLQSPEVVSQLYHGGAVAVIVHRRFLSPADLVAISDSLNQSRAVRFVGNIMEMAGISVDERSRDPLLLALDADVYELNDVRSRRQETECRFRDATSRVQVATAVTGPVHAQEKDGEGVFWWHNGTNGRILLEGRLGVPPAGRRLYLRVGPNPCGVPTRVSVRFRLPDTQALEETVDVNTTITEVSVPLQYRRWWEQLSIEIDAPAVECTLPGDPRNFGFRVFQVLLK